MNERIRDLMLQAGYAAPELAGRAQKLAELIVRECATIVLSGKYDYEKFNADDEFHQGFNQALDGTAEGIKQHFGV